MISPSITLGKISTWLKILTSTVEFSVLLTVMISPDVFIKMRDKPWALLKVTLRITSLIPVLWSTWSRPLLIKLRSKNTLKFNLKEAVPTKLLNPFWTMTAKYSPSTSSGRILHMMVATSSIFSTTIFPMEKLRSKKLTPKTLVVLLSQCFSRNKDSLRHLFLLIALEWASNLKSTMVLVILYAVRKSWFMEENALSMIVMISPRDGTKQIWVSAKILLSFLFLLQLCPNLRFLFITAMDHLRIL